MRTDAGSGEQLDDLQDLLVLQKLVNIPHASIEWPVSKRWSVLEVAFALLELFTVRSDTRDILMHLWYGDYLLA